QKKVLGTAPIRAGGRGLEGIRAGTDEIAGAVLHRSVGNLVELLQRIGIFEVADRTGDQGDQRGDAVIALAAEPERPIDRRALADIRLPVGTDLGKIIRPVERGAGAIETMDDGDRYVRQFQIGIDMLDRRIIPLPDLAEENVREQLPGEADLAGLDAVDMNHWNNAADHQRELHDAE